MVRILVSIFIDAQQASNFSNEYHEGTITSSLLLHLNVYATFCDMDALLFMDEMDIIMTSMFIACVDALDEDAVLHQCKYVGALRNSKRKKVYSKSYCVFH